MDQVTPQFDTLTHKSNLNSIGPLAIVVEWHVRLDKRLGHAISDQKLECRACKKAKGNLSPML